MSSAGFETEIVPSKLIRSGLLSAACGATAAGTMLILFLPIVPELKAPFSALWLISGVAEFNAFRRGMARLDRIRIRSDGSAAGLDRRHALLHPLELLPGSVVLDRVAWLRLRFADGLRYGELVTGRSCDDQQWRRLLVVWRHQAAFGRIRGS